MTLVRALTMPKWGLEMEEGTIVQWAVDEGAAFDLGAELLEIETSKIVNTLQAPFGGTLRRKVAQAGDVLPVGALLGVVADDTISEAAVAAFIADFAQRLPSPKATAADGPRVQSMSSDDRSVEATPMARRLAKQLGVDLRDCSASGSRDRVTEADVHAAASQIEQFTPPDAAPRDAPARADGTPPFGEAVPLSRERSMLGARLQASKRQAPHFRLTAAVDVDGLLEARGRINAESSQPHVSVTDCVIKACAVALVRLPMCNVQFDGSYLRSFPHADICLAMSVNSGLVSPVVRAADTKRLTDIAAETQRLVARARSGQLTVDDVGAGTFTVSNLGMFGIRQFDSIIVAPQVSILSVGAIEKTVVVRNDQPEIASVMMITLSCDHRVIDGITGARFLHTLKELLGKPEAIVAA